MINLLKAIGHIVLSALAITYNAYVMTILWAWFIVATFGLPVLSVPVSVGVIAIAALFKSVNRDNADREDAIVFGHMTSFLKPTACLAVGWVAFKFV
jgi:hypothetical protein